MYRKNSAILVCHHVDNVLQSQRNKWDVESGFQSASNCPPVVTSLTTDINHYHHTEIRKGKPQIRSFVKII